MGALAGRDGRAELSLRAQAALATEGSKVGHAGPLLLPTVLAGLS